MGQEIELKMRIDEGDVNRLFRHPFVLAHTDGPVVEKHLVNRYFDTPELMLRQHGMGLRIRFDGSVYIQTLKRKGKSRDGLSIRGEWEWSVDGPDIEPGRVPPDIWPSAVKNCLDRLIPMFRTDFHRTIWPLQLSFENRTGSSRTTRVEMSLDQGVIAVDKGDDDACREAILEVELELLEGNAEDLFDISKQLGEEIRLVPSNVSKAERGYRLRSVVRNQ